MSITSSPLASKGARQKARPNLIPVRREQRSIKSNVRRLGPQVPPAHPQRSPQGPLAHTQKEATNAEQP